jgi:hypothetical protein
MPPPGAASARATGEPPQAPEAIAAAIATYFDAHPECAVLDDGKVAFDMRSAQFALSTEHGRCTLQLWNDERNLTRRIVSATPRSGALRLATARLGQAQTKLLELVANRDRRTPTTREGARMQYLKTLERVLLRAFADFKPTGFRTAMDLERSFGPAYARGSLVRGQQAWAVIAVSEAESAATVDGILTLGILWLDYCREHAGGRRLYQGLKIIVPQGMATLTLSRLPWLNANAAQWELYELDAKSEELTQRDAADQGNLRTRLVHHPDEAAARERFGDAAEKVLALVPEREAWRVEQRLRSAGELAFLLHGLEFARARVVHRGVGFAQSIEVTFGVGEAETLLTQETQEGLRALLVDLFARRRADAAAKTTDPLYRAAPERWLESVLRADLAPLTRHLGPAPRNRAERTLPHFANDPDPDTIGNRSDDAPAAKPTAAEPSRIIPRLDPAHVYAQVPASAGASDRGLLDLLGVTADGRLAVIELKAAEDLHLALQGLDYWVRVRHHHLSSASGKSELQRHGYFNGVELSPLPPRLYLVAPALRIHPAVEIVLRYMSPQVEWHLLALDERWRSQVRVVWRKESGQRQPSS